MFVRSIWPVLLFKFVVSLLIFCLIVLFIIEHGILESPTSIILLSISPHFQTQKSMSFWFALCSFFFLNKEIQGVFFKDDDGDNSTTVFL